MRTNFNFTEGKVTGNNLRANYDLFRAFQNNKQDSGCKALTARLFIPTYLDPELSWVTSVWELMHHWTNYG